jgi:hypothetical protein
LSFARGALIYAVHRYALWRRVRNRSPTVAAGEMRRRSISQHPDEIAPLGQRRRRTGDFSVAFDPEALVRPNIQDLNGAVVQ